MSDSRNDRPEEGGLFSEDYEPPKRENPYLKKNRDQAKAEKKKEKRSRGEESPYVAVKDKPAYDEAFPIGQKPDAEPSDGTECVRKRTFSDWVFEHVKLIAAVATALAILALVFITDVVSVVEDLVTQSQQEDKEELTLTYLKGLSEKSSPISWGDLDRFKRDESKAKNTVTWMIPVQGDQYEVWISGSSTAKAPAYIYLFDLNTGDKMVLGEDNFDIFIREHTKK